MGEVRLDYDADSICVVLPIPESVEGVPDIENNGEPHVTVVYVGPGSLEDAGRIADIVDAEIATFIDEPLALADLDHFDRDDFVVAHARVLVTPTLADARERVVSAIEGAGFEVKHHPGPWRPHATLAYMEPGSRYQGDVPTGSWCCEGAEVWRGDERLVLGARGDKLKRRGAKWIVLNAAGDKELGEYDTEAEARERLRQIEAAKAARDDGVEIMDACARKDQRSDEEKADIRRRWQDEGPNMGAAKLERWLESPFAGPNRKSGDARTRARRVASRALRLMKKSTTEWNDRDYSDALQVLAFIARMREVEPGDPLTIDGREGPSPQRAALMDWGFDPRLDASSIEDRSDQAAPAVITAPKTMVEIERRDACEVVEVHCYGRDGRELKIEDLVRRDADGGISMAPEVHPDGWVEYTVFYSRAGNVQVYGDVREYRPFDEVFAPRSLASGRGGPWELRHSSKLLSPATVRGVARGCMRTFDRHPDGIHTWGRAKAWDRGLIDAIAGHAPEVSLAWRGLVDRRGGTTDDGRRFDQIAREIIVNSLASEPRGRAGPSVRVYADSADGAEVVTSAARMLEIAESGPTSTVYYDRRDWMRYDSAMRFSLDQDLPIRDIPWDPEGAYNRLLDWCTDEDGELDVPRFEKGYLFADDDDAMFPVVDIDGGSPVVVVDALLDAAEVISGMPDDAVEEANGLTEEYVQDRTRGRVKALTALGAARSSNKSLILQGKKPRIGGKAVSPSTFKKKTGTSVGKIKKSAISQAGSKTAAIKEAKSQAAASRRRARSAARAVRGKPGARVRPRSDELSPDAELGYPRAASEKQDAAMPMDLVKKLLEARGLTPADAASALGVTGEADLQSALYSLDNDSAADKLVALLMGSGAPEGTQDMDNDKREKIAELMKMMGEETMDGDMRAKARAMFDEMMPPGDGSGENGEMVEVMIGEEKIMVPAAVKAELESLRQRVQSNGERADRAEGDLSKFREESVPRQDADRMIVEHGLIAGDVVELARRSYGNEFQPEPRQDCADLPTIIVPADGSERQDADKSVPQPTLADWQRAALCGAYGDEKGGEYFDAIARAPEAARGHLMKVRIDGAREILDQKAHKSAEVKESIGRMRENHANDKTDRANHQDGADPLAAEMDRAEEVASARRTPA